MPSATKRCGLHPSPIRWVHLFVVLALLVLTVAEGRAASWVEDFTPEGRFVQGRLERLKNAMLSDFPGEVFDAKVFVGYVIENIDGSVVYTPVKMTITVDPGKGLEDPVRVELRRLGRPIIAPSGSTNGQVSALSVNTPATVPEDASGQAVSLSRDATTVVGYYDHGFSTPYHAFVWIEETDVVDLGTLDPVNNDTWASFATDVNDDGSVVVGYSQTPGGTTIHAFRWTQVDGMVDLGSAAGASGFSRAWGVSGDGRVIVGESEFPDGTRQAFRWTDAGGFELLGTLDGTPSSRATAISGDANTIVGMARVNLPLGNTTVSRRRAFRWTQADGMQDLGVVTGYEDSAATAVSDDGVTVVGFSLNGDPGQGIGVPYGSVGDEYRAFIWTATDGTRDLGQALADAGVDMTGITVLSVTGMSPDAEWMSCAAITRDTPAFKTTSALASLTYAPPDPNATPEPAAN